MGIDVGKARLPTGMFLASAVVVWVGCAAPSARRRCVLELKRCVILLEEAGTRPRVAPPEAIACDEARRHAAQMAADAPVRKAWAQEISIFHEADFKQDCADAKIREQDREGIPWQDAR